MAASVLRLLLVALTTAALGCSSDGSSACSDDTPCGGDITGTWNIVEGCDYPTLPSGTGPCASTTRTVLSGVGGTITFNADSTYSMRESFTSENNTESRPLSCTMPAGSCSCQGTAKCTCVKSETTCSCTYPYPAGVWQLDSTYTASAGVLTLHAPTAGINILTQSYCVSGNTLHLFPRLPTTTNVPALTVVATR